MDPDSYCREIEAYLCRKNDGHLVRVVGPAFQMVGAWAAQGVPFKVACRGIDRYFERYYAKGPRRRPVRIEFCEGDVLDAFDEWRRAVGVGTAGRGDGPAEAGPHQENADERKHGPSLRAHLDRVVMRLTDLQAGAAVPPALEAMVARLIVAMGNVRDASRTLRGDARQSFLATLEQLDHDLLDVARSVTAQEVLDSVRGEAAEELAGYRARMPQEAYGRALRAAADRLLREHWKLPTITYPA